MNLRVRAEADLKFSLEGEWGLPVILIDPDGVEQTKSVNDPTEDLSGQILYDHRVVDSETGMEHTVNTPVVTLRISSLLRVPKDGENWGMKFPLVPDPAAPKTTFILIGRPPEGGASIGFIRLYPQLPEQQ